VPRYLPRLAPGLSGRVFIMQERKLLSGNEAVALAALHVGLTRGAGYPGTPSTEILENAARLGVPCQWSPNEKVALEVALGVAFAGGRALMTTKHVGVNVAADPLFTATYTGVTGALVIVACDDPGLASSQNEQDSRRYAEAAGAPMLEPCDSQQAYDYARLAFQVSERWGLPVILRMTTRVCHSKTIVRSRAPEVPRAPSYVQDIPARVMIPGYARTAHRRLRAKLAEIAAWNEAEGPVTVHARGADLGIVADGICVCHALEAAPGATVMAVGMIYPLPVERIRAFASRFPRCAVVEEGDPVLSRALLAAGVRIEPRPEPYRFGELDVDRVRRLLAGETAEPPPPPPGKPPQLCPGCPHRTSFDILKRLGCIVAGDIGCYTLGVMPPFQTMDTCVCMGASIGVGLGLRHALPPEQARRVVSVIGDSTFIHSGLTGVADMVYNRPPTGHVVLILDNATTAMTGLQEHPGTGRLLDHRPAAKTLSIEETCRAMGVDRVTIVDPTRDAAGLEKALADSMASDDLTVIVARRPCILAVSREAKAAKAAKG